MIHRFLILNESYEISEDFSAKKELNELFIQLLKILEVEKWVYIYSFKLQKKHILQLLM